MKSFPFMNSPIKIRLHYLCTGKSRVVLGTIIWLLHSPTLSVQVISKLPKQWERYKGNSCETETNSICSTHTPRFVSGLLDRQHDIGMSRKRGKEQEITICFCLKTISKSTFRWPVQQLSKYIPSGWLQSSCVQRWLPIFSSSLFINL